MQIALSHFCMELWTLYVFPAYTQGKRLYADIDIFICLIYYDTIFCNYALSHSQLFRKRHPNLCAFFIFHC
ncbi:hypothetical protein [Eubacterium sp. AB3007]|uniref:hypothetical protein n=1 Tax=Eubacterium sp. AB3007 TaxID=1392487 RepID=UPI0004817D11|nr:hypothetical protein [Eubacterium sp. AB3007]